MKRLIDQPSNCKKNVFFSSISDAIRIEQFREYWNKIIEKIIKLNIFQSTRPELVINNFELKTQIISTRVFFVLLCVPLFVLAVYTSQIPVTTMITVPRPSYNNYSLMYSHYSQPLSCPCSTVSIRYGQFLTVQATRFHQICQSVYVTIDWTSLINDAHLYHVIFPEDFRLLGGRFSSY